MSHLVGLLIATAIVVLVALALLVSLRIRRSKSLTSDVSMKEFLSANELEFLSRLETAVPEYRFHAQVAMGALLQPTVTAAVNRSDHFKVRGTFSQKIVDFAAQNRQTGELIAIIELDDRTHDPRKDAIRDQMLRSAGYRIIRWNARTKPAIEEIREQLMGAR